MAFHSRLKRVEEQIRLEIATIIQKNLKDPRLTTMISVLSVRVSKDLRSAKVYISSLNANADNIRETLDVLNKAKGFIRKLLGERLTIKYTPELEFFYDDSIEYAAHINQVLYRLHKEEETSR